jgi:hypothetical protein
MQSSHPIVYCSRPVLFDHSLLVAIHFAPRLQSLQKIEQIIREEVQKTGAQELIVPTPILSNCGSQPIVTESLVLP